MKKNAVSDLRVVSTTNLNQIEKGIPKPLLCVLHNAENHLTILIDNCLTQAQKKLVHLAKQSFNETQQRYLHANKTLNAQAPLIGTDFQFSLTKLFYRFAQGDVDQALFTSDLPDQAFTLLANDELDEVLLKETVAKCAGQKYELTLDKLKSCFYEFTPHKPEDSSLFHYPLEPFAITDCFTAATEKYEIDTDCRKVLLSVFDESVISHMLTLYNDAILTFSTHGVFPNISQPSQRKVKKPANQASPIVSSIQNRQPAQSSASLQNRSDEISTRSDEINGAKMDTTDSDQQGSSLTSQQAMLLTALSHLNTQVTGAEETEANQLVEQLDRILDIMGSKTGISDVDKTNLSAITRAFSQLEHSRTFAKPTHDLFNLLLVPFLKLSITDQDGLKQHKQTTQTLFDTLSQLDFFWHDDPNSRQLEQVKTLLNRLNSTADTSKHTLASTVDELKTLCDKQHKKIELLEDRLSTAEEGKAKAKHVQEKVRESIDQILQKTKPNNISKEILQNAWKQVLFYDSLKHGIHSPEWQRDIKNAVRISNYHNQIPKCRTDTRRKRYIRHLTDILKSNLERISYHEFKLDKIMAAFTNSAGQIEQALRSQENPIITRNTTATTAKVFSLVRTQKDNESRPTQVPADLQAEYRAIHTFKRGQLFDLRRESGILRCRLAAVIRQTNTYIFVDGKGCKVLECKIDELARSLQNNTLVTVESDHIFENILESLISIQAQPNLQIGA